MKSTKSVRLITDVIAKRTTTTTTASAKAAAATAEQMSYYEPAAAAAACPHLQNQTILSNATTNYETVRPYSEVPGPKPLPILGNTWR